MTREKAAALLPIIQAYSEGKMIEVRVTLRSPWEDCHSPAFNADPEYYRIKPQPTEWTLAVSKLDGSIFGEISELVESERDDWRAVRVREIMD